jgi:MFS family permease
MTAVYMLNHVDRGLMVLLLQPIKTDLKLSDTQLGLLTGIAFGLFYATLGVPIARWADRGNRVTIASLAIGFWGLTLMAYVFVAGFAQLVFARIAAAVGEAGGKPPTYSLVGDYFPGPAERTRAMGIYNTANPLTSLMSFALAGWLNEIYGWRLTFLLMGIPGLVLAVLVKMTIVEPRQQAGRARIEAPPPVPMRAVLATLWHRRSCRHLTIAQILLLTMGSGLGPWYAAFMMRSHGMGTAELGIWLGVIIGLSGICGVLMGGYVASRWFTGDERGQMRLAALTVASVVPFFAAFLLVPNKHLALIALIPLFMMLGSLMAPLYALMQRLVPDEMRATVLAVVMLLASVIGMGLGPLIVGMLSDLLTPRFGTDALRYSMLSMSLIALWTGFHFRKAGDTVKENLSS